ncbi:MAG TPA: R3H domain-containing nucleic acid-binding protein [Candidatus Paceibacterota bacterium]|nr:R3H domain-containing nucleic acid-binding protein [Candidatus Paceibacterota bacterium]
MKKSEVQNLIKDLIEKTTVGIKEILVEEKDPKNIWFSIEVDNPYFFTNHGGEALSALNHIVRKILEAKNPPENPESFNVLIDINGFQKKRIDNVRAVAHMMAERARYFKSSIDVEPMSAFERRIVHEFLADALDLKTESVGEGPARHIVIRYTGSL